MNGSRTTVVRWSDEYHHSPDKVEYEMLKELQKKDKRYKKGLEGKVYNDLRRDYSDKNFD